ncbi:MAG: BrnA antitoxin family protein [Nitrospira sp.]|nr:BrnA antitoxin family protein [Nitrospira sp.]
MKKEKPSALSVRGKRVVRSGRHISDSAIDFSDIPELSNVQLKRMRRIGRPATGMAKQLIAIRLSPRLLATLRQMAAKRGKPYQTLIHELLEKAASRAA